MKQKEKTQKTRERIISAAISEFASKSYDQSSLNSICISSGISKGLFYHNFKSKDELYLFCVKLCYDSMTEYLKAQDVDFHSPKGLQRLLEFRQAFFTHNPEHAGIFFNSLLRPPKHLLKELLEIKEEFDRFNMDCYQRMLQSIHLREGVTEKAAMEYFSVLQEMFNSYFQRKADQGNDYGSLIEDHEGALSWLLDIILYGIANEDSEKVR